MSQNSRLNSIIREHFPHAGLPHYSFSDKSSSISFMNFEIVAPNPPPEPLSKNHSPAAVLDEVLAEALKLVVDSLEESRRKKKELKMSELEKVACSHKERVARKKAVKKRIDEFLTRAQAQNSVDSLSEREPCFIDAVDGDIGRDIRKFLSSSCTTSDKEREDKTQLDSAVGSVLSQAKKSDGDDKASDIARHSGDLSDLNSKEDKQSEELDANLSRSEFTVESCGISLDKTASVSEGSSLTGFPYPKEEDEGRNQENELLDHPEVVTRLSERDSQTIESVNEAGGIIEDETPSSHKAFSGVEESLQNNGDQKAQNGVSKSEAVFDAEIESSNQCSTPGYYDQEMLEEQIGLEERRKALQKAFVDLRPKNRTKAYFDDIMGIVSEIGYTEALRRICEFYLFCFPEYEICRENCVYVCTATFAGIDFLSPYVFDKTTAKESSAQKICEFLSENWHVLFTA